MSLLLSSFLVYWTLIQTAVSIKLIFFPWIISFSCLCLSKSFLLICLRITLHLYVHDSFLFIDISAIYFSEKQADGRSSKDFLFPVILVIVFAVIGMYLIFMWRKEICHFFRKKGNIIIEVHVIYCGFISFSGHDFHWVIEITKIQYDLSMDNVSIITLYF